LIVTLFSFPRLPHIAMSISWEQFVDYANNFITDIKIEHDNWVWMPDSLPVRGKSYLRRIERYILKDRKADAQISSDDPTIISVNSHDNFYELQIVYSTTYQVPVLYFSCYHTSGEPLTLQEVWDDLPPHFGALSQKETLITQMVTTYK
jgi:hypothetical protein